MLSSLPLLHYYLTLFSSVKTTEHLWAGQSCLHSSSAPVQVPHWAIFSLWPPPAAGKGLHVSWCPPEGCTSPMKRGNYWERKGNYWERPRTGPWMTTKKTITHPRGWTCLPVLATSRHSAVSSFSSWNNSCLVNSCSSNLPSAWAKLSQAGSLHSPAAGRCIWLLNIIPKQIHPCPYKSQDQHSLTLEMPQDLVHELRTNVKQQHGWKYLLLG